MSVALLTGWVAAVHGGERRVFGEQCTQNWEHTACGKQGEARQNGARPGRRAGGQQMQTEGALREGYWVTVRASRLREESGGVVLCRGTKLGFRIGWGL